MKTLVNMGKSALPALKKAQSNQDKEVAARASLVMRLLAIETQTFLAQALTPGDHLVVNVVAPKVEEIPEVVLPGAEGVEGAAAAEPELIAKGKEKEGGEAGAEKAPGGKKEVKKEAAKK